MAVSCLISVKIRLSHLTWTAAIGQKTKEHQCLEIALESDWKCTTVGGPLWRGLSCCGKTACDGTTHASQQRGDMVARSARTARRAVGAVMKSGIRKPPRKEPAMAGTCVAPRGLTTRGVA